MSIYVANMDSLVIWTDVILTQILKHSKYSVILANKNNLV